MPGGSLTARGLHATARNGAYGENPFPPFPCRWKAPSASSLQVEQVDFITVPTRDIERSVAWYREVLGLPASEKADNEVETPNVTLSFWNPEREGLEFKPNEAGFAVRVADVEEARRELEAKGVEFIGETYDSSVCLMGFCKDPDGNTVILHRRYKPHG